MLDNIDRAIGVDAEIDARMQRGAIGLEIGQAVVGARVAASAEPDAVHRRSTRDERAEKPAAAYVFDAHSAPPREASTTVASMR